MKKFFLFHMEQIGAGTFIILGDYLLIVGKPTLQLFVFCVDQPQKYYFL